MTKTGVLIVGGGPVGLSAALFLKHHQVPFILVERAEQDSILPRARGWHVRSLELFRQVGLEDAVQAAAKAAWEQGVFGGARRGRTMLDSEALDIPSKRKMVELEPSPSSFCGCPQTLLEPVLRRPLQESGADLRYGYEVTGLSQDEEGVTVDVRDTKGNKVTILAKYVVGADGGGSFVRSKLGIETSRTPAETHYANLFFRADLTEAVRGKTFSQCAVANNQVRGLFLSKNNTTEWSFHLEYDPATSDPMEAPDAELIEAIRAAIGSEDIPVEILAKTKWNTSVRVADSFQLGRVFLAGDAAHTMPPWGGFNGNTGIADAHNLAWKIAAVLNEQTDINLLDSYTRERRPVAVRNGHQALLRTDFDARFEIETEANRELFTGLQNSGTLLMRYRYSEDADLSSSNQGTVELLSGQPGTRFPHAWIEHQGKRISTLDLFGSGYVLLQGPSSDVRHQPMQDTTVPSYKVGSDFRFSEGEVTWSTLTGLADNEALLIRPDGFVSSGELIT